MLSVRVEVEVAKQVSRWAQVLGIGRSDLVREALRRHLAALAAQNEHATYAASPLDDDELSLTEIADWGPAEDWVDWAPPVDPSTREAR